MSKTRQKTRIHFLLLCFQNLGSISKNLAMRGEAFFIGRLPVTHISQSTEYLFPISLNLTSSSDSILSRDGTHSKFNAWKVGNENAKKIPNFYKMKNKEMLRKCLLAPLLSIESSLVDYQYRYSLFISGIVTSRNKLKRFKNHCPNFFCCLKNCPIFLGGFAIPPASRR